MPKMKSRKSLTKRIKVTGTGKIRRCKMFSGCHHILEKKSQKRKRGFRKTSLMSASDVKRMKKALPYLNN